MNGQSAWLNYSQEIQQRSLQSCNLNVKDAKTLHTQIFKALSQAQNEKYLKTKLADIYGLLKMSPSKHNKVVILGGLDKDGTKNFKRSKDIPHFTRADGCWFDFAITIDEGCKPAEIIGFDFEIRFPDEKPVRFVRFDLNLPAHNNDDKGLRFHFHPSSDDLMLHSPPMTPLEILHLFLYGLEIPEKLRN